MCASIEITVFASQDSDRNLVEELLQVRQYLSSRVRNLVSVECIELENSNLSHGIGIAVDGYLVHENTLSALVDFLHMQVWQAQAA